MRMNYVWWIDSNNFSMFYQSTNQNIFGTKQNFGFFSSSPILSISSVICFTEENVSPLQSSKSPSSFPSQIKTQGKKHCSFCVIRLPSSMIVCFPVAVKNTMAHLVFKSLRWLVVLPYGSLIIEEITQTQTKN